MRVRVIAAVLIAISLVAQAQVKTKATVKIQPKTSAANASLAAPSVALTCSAATSGTVLANGFNFYRSALSSMSGATLLNIVPQSACSYLDTAVTFGATYYYAATGLNTLTCPAGSTCESAYSNIAQAVVPGNPIPNPPTLGTPVVTAGNVQLKWTEQGSYSAFRVYRKPSSRGWFSQIATGVKVETYADKNLKAGSYQYEVAAVDRVGNTTYLSVPSNIQSITIP